MENADHRNVDQIKERIATYWNGRAGQYDSHFGHGIFSDDETRAWLNTLQKHLPHPAGVQVLDVGCGTGFLSLLMSRLGFQVTGVDFSHEMMGEAARKAADQELQITWLHGDAESPPVPPHQFQAVVSRHLLWTLPSPETALIHWKNLLPPGGRVIVIDGIWTPRTPYAKAMSYVAATVSRIKGQRRNGSWEREYLRDPGDLPFMGGAEPDAVVQLFRQVGLADIQVDPMAEVIRCEKKIAPLEHRLRYALGQTRYLISGVNPA